MKQTAVEWLVEQVFCKHTCKWRNVIEQAKEMENQQHGKTWDTALDKYEVRAGNYMRAYEDFDDYYNETYRSKGSDHDVDTNKMV